MTAAIPIHSAAAVGAGTVGAGIAVALANARIPVLLKEADSGSA
jgi:3-hydroxyacyl-CoA dehydrogenase